MPLRYSNNLYFCLIIGTVWNGAIRQSEFSSRMYEFRMKKVLVTGATGLLGNNIVRLLVNDGVSVRAAVRSTSDRRPVEGLAIEVVPIDFEDVESIKRAVDGVDVVVHSAGFIWFGWMKLTESRRANVEYSRRLAEVCREKEVRFIHVSTVDTLPASDGKTPVSEDSNGLEKPACNYVVSKTEAERAVEAVIEKGLDAVIVHPGLFLGPWDWKPSSGELIRAVKKLGYFFTCPTGGISVSDVRDVARGTLLAATKGEAGRHYILGGENVRYKHLCREIARKCGVLTPQLRTGPVAYLVAATTGLINRARGNETLVNTAAIRMARYSHFYSSERAKVELGYQWRPLDETLDDAIEWLSANNKI